MSGPAPPAPPSGGLPKANANVPAITQPIATPEANTRVILQLRQAVQSLGGQIGNYGERAATLDELDAVTAQANSLQSQVTALDTRLTTLEAKVAAMPPPP
jgi:ubiquinone biosynthesis protein UbiJ